MSEKTKTSIKIDPELWKEAKIQAIQHDMDLSELVEEAIRQWIEEGGSRRKPGDQE